MEILTDKEIQKIRDELAALLCADFVGTGACTDWEQCGLNPAKCQGSLIDQIIALITKE